MARMMPLSDRTQRVLTSQITVEPRPQHEGMLQDYFGNTVHWFHLDTDHSDLSLTMTAEVDVTRQPDLISDAAIWELSRDRAHDIKDLSPNSPAHYLWPTSLTVADGAIEAFARGIFTSESPIRRDVLALTETIQREFTYAQDTTSVDTSAQEAFAQRTGVCQDFAHIMIAACRNVGLPARYVSGYLRTLPPPGRPRLEGADAMHAWVSVWVDAATGWIDFDPTNGCAVLDEHISVAVGRDYTDTAPIRGEVVGHGSQKHTVAVDVVPA